MGSEPFRLAGTDGIFFREAVHGRAVEFRFRVRSRLPPAAGMLSRNHLVYDQVCAPTHLMT